MRMHGLSSFIAVVAWIINSTAFGALWEDIHIECTSSVSNQFGWKFLVLGGLFSTCGGKLVHNWVQTFMNFY